MKEKYLVTRTARELADALGLHPSVALEWEVRTQITKRINDSESLYVRFKRIFEKMILKKYKKGLKKI